MIKNKNYLEIKEVLKDVIVPRDKNLILLKIKEVFQIESCDINVEEINYQTVYTIRYEEIQISLTIDSIKNRFILSPHFDVFDEVDNIIECQ